LLLGPFEATLNETPLHFRTRSVQALLICLVCEGEQSLQREALMELLWPGMPLASAQANLRQTLYRPRQAILEVKAKENSGPVPLVISNRQTVQIHPEAHYYADIQVFERLIGKEPARALEVYRADFLSDFFLPDSDAFEAWTAARRAAYRRQFLGTLETQTAVSRA
jgi:DNA-binding SARP family transcriptional activator